MSIKLIEGFDYYNTSALAALKGWVAPTSPGSGSFANSFVAGRLGGNAWRLALNTTGSGGNISYFTRKALPSTYTTVVAGFAIRVDTLTHSSGLYMRLDTAAGAAIAQIFITSAGIIQVKNSGGTVIASGTTTILANTWNYIELKLFVNGASGTCEVHLNGATEIASTVGNFGSTAVGSVLFIVNYITGNDTTSTNLDFDDIYVVDTSASPNNDFLGDIAVETIFPSADGNYSQWTPDSGGVHFSRVNENPPNGDTSYDADSNVGDRDSYAFGNLASALGTVKGIQANIYARKDDAGFRQVAIATRPTSTDFDGTAQTLSTSYAFFSEIREVNPDTSAAWTISEVNASEFGVKVVA